MKSKYLFVRNNTPKNHIIKNSLNNFTEYNDLDTIFLHDTISPRIGIMWNNVFSYIPIGTENLIIDNYQYKWFKKEFYDLISSIDSTIIIDLITCNMNDNKFIEEVKKIENKFNNVKINYSLNYTGNDSCSDWIMESNGENIKYVYFTDNIDNYDVHLGATNKHTMIVLSNGNVMSYGLNDYYQLGDGTNIDRSERKLVLYNGNPIDNVIHASCGSTHTALVLGNGYAVAFGNNQWIQLGNEIISPNNIVYISSNTFVPFNNISYVSCGDQHTAALLPMEML